MSILAWLALGLVAGWLAKKITPQKEKGGLLTSLIIGIAGAFVGGIIASSLIGVALTGFNPISILVALGGSLLVLFVYHKFIGGRKR